MNQSKTDQEILTKAIEKAIAGGWNFAIDDNGYRGTHSWMVGEGLEIAWRLDKNAPLTPINVYQVIFNHDFARALWPAEQKRWIPEQRINRYYDGTSYLRPGHYQRVVTKWCIRQLPSRFVGQQLHCRVITRSWYVVAAAIVRPHSADRWDCSLL
jgi:hypothetical protein